MDEEFKENHISVDEWFKIYDRVIPTKIDSSIICHICGVKWEGMMLYCCSNINCPIQLKVTC